MTVALALARSSPAGAADTRELRFWHTHTGERLRVTYFEHGRYLPDALATIDHYLRDFRSGEVHVIAPALLDSLSELCANCGGGTFEVISGFRSPQTNDMLRRAGGGGVAARSLHMDGRAIDVRFTGFATARLCQVALQLRRGGVGYYPGLNFVHLDIGRVRQWRG
ncbi:MAG: DUF882 domain-containing protein [Gammaproteobacteria bacterium]|nr:DUF882 domain-containing protein [Gammaproteobacteria bacterium]